MKKVLQNLNDKSVLSLSDPLDDQDVKSKFDIQDLWTDIPKILDTVLIIAGLLVVIFLIMGGIQYITAGGDDGKQKAAKKTITNSIIGLIVVLLSFGIKAGIQTLITGTAS